MTQSNYCIFIAFQYTCNSHGNYHQKQYIINFLHLNQFNSVTLTRLSYEKDVVCCDVFKFKSNLTLNSTSRYSRLSHTFRLNSFQYLYCISLPSNLACDYPVRLLSLFVCLFSLFCLRLFLCPLLPCFLFCPHTSFRLSQVGSRLGLDIGQVLFLGFIFLSQFKFTILVNIYSILSY